MSATKTPKMPATAEAVESLALEAITEFQAPHVGETVWLWGKAMRGGRAHAVPLPSLVIVANDDPEYHTVDLTAFDKNGPTFLGSVPYSDKPTLGHWSRPLAGWLPDQGVPVNDRPRVPIPPFAERVEAARIAKKALARKESEKRWL